jgi:hypothetical protein
MRLTAFVAGGAFLGGAAEYVHLNAARIEVLAVNADGFPLWSQWQIPFTLPGAVAGALVGLGVGTVLRRRRRHKAGD